METLITIALLLLLTAVSNWLQKRSQGHAQDTLPETDQAPPPSPRTEPKPRAVPPAHASARRRTNPQVGIGRVNCDGFWRRLPVKNPLPPPHPRRQVPRPRPPAPMPTVPRSVAQPPARTMAPQPLTSPPAAVIHPIIESRDFEASQQAYESASRLSSQVEDHLRRVTEYKGSTAAARGQRPIMREVAAALALLRQPSSARQAIIVSTVLGPPKALQER